MRVACLIPISNLILYFAPWRNIDGDDGVMCTKPRILPCSIISPTYDRRLQAETVRGRLIVAEKEPLQRQTRSDLSDIVRTFPVCPGSFRHSRRSSKNLSFLSFFGA